MKRSNFILGLRRVRRGKRTEEASADAEEEDWDLQEDLFKPDRIVNADDTNAYQLFGDSICCAPQEDLLEGTKL